MSNKIKRDFYNGIHYELDEENKTIILKDKFYKALKDKKILSTFWPDKIKNSKRVDKGFKKIGGSSIGDVLQVNNFASEFAAYCRMTWISLPIIDRKYVDAGIAIEPMVIEQIEDVTKKKVTTYDPFKYNFDFFADKDDVVGGLPDGYIEVDKNILEIKTTGAKNLDKWNTYGVPQNYLKQAQLYAYLMGAEKYTIVATFLKEEDYADPSKYPIKKRMMKNWKYDLDEAVAKDDIKIVKEWYAKYTSSPQSPKWDERKDAELLEWLRISNEEEFNKWCIKYGVNS